MLKILLADDEYHIITHIAALLEKIDFCETNILMTGSSLEALQIIASSHIDIAILDINMPEVSGLQIAKRLHAQWPDCQIIFLTAYAVFDYIYETSQYPNATYLLKSEPDVKIQEVAASCCKNVLQKHAEKNRLNNMHQKERLLTLLQEQQLLRRVLYGDLPSDWNRFVKDASLDIHISLEKKSYLILMHVRHARSEYSDISFYMEKMQYLLGNLFLFSFVETEKGFLLWIFQEKDNPVSDFSYFDCLKDTMSSFLDICEELKHQTLSLYLLQEQVDWGQLAQSYQFLYDVYYEDAALLDAHSSVAKVITQNVAVTPSSASLMSKTAREKWTGNALHLCLASMKQSLYQNRQKLFFDEFQRCCQYCIDLKSMHHIKAIQVYSSIALIYLDYIEHYSLAHNLSQEIALYPLYNLNDFRDWEYAFAYLRRLGELLFQFSNEANKDKNQQLIISIQKYIQTHLSDNLNLTVIANHVNYNESHVSRMFKRHTGHNLSDYITTCRIEHAKLLLDQTAESIQTISQKTGFHTSQYFSSTFRKITGESPQEYRQRSSSEP